MRYHREKRIHSHKGFSLLEAILAVSIFAAVFLAVTGTYGIYIRSAVGNTPRVQAAFLSEEGIEILRFLRDNGWAASFGSFTSNTPYGFEFNAGSWTTISSPEYIGSFERTFKVYDVYRDTNDDIASSGTLDSDIKKATVFVRWPTRSGTTTASSTTYFTNLFGS